ncbi:hypothetical protein [Lentibacillus salinarum]|uniref:Uncharacterized protein n=1 Tax=Lentibacillus salinarum TaxID=446820 RepID=A0ABW3ZXP6_9BACI
MPEMGYTSVEVIPLKKSEILSEIKKMDTDELREFHKDYIEFLNQLGLKGHEDALVVGENYHFWLNKEDEVYDEKYGHL